MTDETNQPVLPQLTLVIEVPTREQLCENATDKYAVKFAQVVQGVLFAALKAKGHSVAEIEALCTTSKSTIMGNQKMLNLRDSTEVVWGEVEGRQLHALMGGEIAVNATEALSAQTAATVTALDANAAAVEQRATEIGENAVRILDNPMGAGVVQPGETNVVPLGGQLDPNQAAQDAQLAGQVATGPNNPPVGNGVSYDQFTQAHGHAPDAHVQIPAQPAMAPPAAQTMAPPAQPPQFDVTAIDAALAQHFQTAPHPTGDPAQGVRQGEIMYWQANPAVAGGGQWLNRVATYGAMGQQPPEMVQQVQQAQPGMLPPGGVPGQPAIGTPVGPQGDAVQRVQPVPGGWPHQ